MLEKERVQKGAADSRTAVQRPRRESKSQKMAEIKRMGDLMLSRIVILDEECSSPSGAPSAAITPVTQQRVPWVSKQQHSRSRFASSSTQTQTNEEEGQLVVAP